MVNDSVRYLVEHVALRDALFSAGPRGILDFMDNPGPAMIELYKELGEEMPGHECPYRVCDGITSGTIPTSFVSLVRRCALAQGIIEHIEFTNGI